MSDTIEAIDTLDLYEHYLTSPLSEARFRESTLTFVVNGYIYDGFCDLIERLGWELVESRELAEETFGGWANVTIKRRQSSQPDYMADAGCYQCATKDDRRKIDIGAGRYVWACPAH